MRKKFWGKLSDIFTEEEDKSVLWRHSLEFEAAFEAVFGEEIVSWHPVGLVTHVKLPQVVLVPLATVELDSHALVPGEIEERQELPVAGYAVQLALFVGVPAGTLSSDALTFEIV